MEESKLPQLYELLDKAVKLIAEFKGGYSNYFSSAEEFHFALAESVQKLKAGDKGQISNLWLWFAPSSDWDDFSGKEGTGLGNEIFVILSELEKSI